ncbi:MAG: hypothetical protein RLP44_09015 [Aggregatilineales bacterium]
MSESLFTPRMMILRLGLLATGIILLSVGSNLADTIPTGGGVIPYVVPGTVWIAGALLLLLCLLPHLRGWMSGLILVGLLGALGSYAYVQATLYSPLYWTRTDNEMIGEYSVEVLQSGNNPYTWDYTDMTRVFRDRGNRTTQFLDNSTQHRVTYPIFPTLLLYAFDVMGIDQARAVTFMFLCALLILMYFGAPPEYRPLVLLPIFIQKDFIILSFIGAQDVVWSALLVAMILAWKYPIWRAVLFGFAVNFRQQPWFVAPFLVLMLWDDSIDAGETLQQRIRRVAQFVSIPLGMFIVFNLPFFLMNPTEWLLSAFEPSYARFNVFSQGLAALTQYGVGSLTREYYTIAHLSLYAVLLFIGWRHRRQMGQAYWILPGIFFWVYYRGLGNYWLYWMPPLMMAMLCFKNQPEIGEERVSLRPALAISGAYLVTVILLAFLPMFHSERVSAEIIAPIETTNIGSPRVDRLHVRVTNHADTAFRPRFSLQFERVTEAYTWTIETGPEWLSASETADYVISADGASGKMFAPERGAQVVVSDAGRNYAWRTVATIPNPDDEPQSFERLEHFNDADVVTESVDDPAQYYLSLASRYVSLGEVAAARNAYIQALAYDTENPQAVAGLSALGDSVNPDNSNQVDENGGG